IIGGAVGALKFLTEERNKELESLRRRLQDSRESEEHTEYLREKAGEREKEALLTLEKYLREIDEDTLSPENLASVRRIIGLVEENRGLQDRLNDCKIAAKWLRFRQREWISESILSVKKNIPRNKRRLFEKNVSWYLDWAHACLQIGHPDISLKKFVANPILSSPFLYIKAIRLIKEKKDWGDLKASQSSYLEKILNELMDRLRSESD
ncbi:MAG: hypothetical protein WBC73_03240, partial [Phormidesmis sp.]